MTNPIHLDPDALLAAVASLVADRLTNEPDGNDFDVRVNLAIKQAIDGIVRERVAAMIDRLLVERASETFAACDHAIELVRMETMRAARQRVAENLPSKDDVRRESLAIVRDAVMRTFEPVVAKVAEVANGVGIAFDPNPASFPAPEPIRPVRNHPPPGPAAPMNPQPKRHGEPGGPGGDCMAGVQTAPCECYGCSPPF